MDCVHESAPWSARAMQARRYMHNRQWDDAEDFEQDEFHITNNVIRRAIEQMVTRIMEADPVIDTHGRGAEDFQLGDLWKDLLRWSEEWTGYLFDSVADVRRRVFMDAYQTGESFEKVWWCPWEEGGLGMVVHEHVEGLQLLWPREAVSAQLRDAEYLLSPKPVEIELLEREFPKLKGQISPDYPNRFVSALEPAAYDQYQLMMEEAESSGSPVLSRDRKAYRIEVWQKAQIWVNRYYRKDNGRLAIMPQVNEETGERTTMPMSEAAYDRQPTDVKETYQTHRVPRFELSKGVLVNKFWAEKNAVHEYDEGKGGHGEYPFARYSLNWDPNQSKGHGEVEYLVGWQDYINRMTSRLVQAAFVANAVILATQKGSAPRQELAKLDHLGEKPIQRFSFYPGQQIPQFINTNPGSVQLYQGILQYFQQQFDDKSAIQGVNRGAPEYALSGKAVRALQSEADLIGVLPRKCIESGLRQATMLSIACMQKYMRGARLARITPKAGGQDPYSLFIADSTERAAAAFNLEPEMANLEVGGKKMSGRTGNYISASNGEKGKVLEISDKSVRKFDIRYQLDSGRQARKDERMQLVQAFLAYTGPAAGIEVLLWAADLMEVPNPDKLAEALRKEDGKTQIFTALQQAAKEAGMDVQALIQLAVAAAQAQQGQPQGQPVGAPMGPQGPPPPGMGGNGQPQPPAMMPAGV